MGRGRRMTVADEERRAPAAAQVGAPSPRLGMALVANALLRIAGSSAGALVTFYLASLAAEGRVASAVLLGWLGVVFNGAELVAALPIGVLADRFTPRLVLVVGGVVGAVAVLAFGLSESVAVFYVARALQGCVAATAGPPLLAFLTDATEHDHALRGRTMGFYELSLLGGLALGALVGGTLWDQVRDAAFVTLAVVYLVGAALFFWSTATPRRQSASANAHTLASMLAPFRDPQLRRLAPAWLAINAIIGMWLTHVTFQLNGPRAAGQYLVGRFSASEVGQILLVYAILFAVGAIAWGYALARVSRLRALRISLGALALATGALFLLNSSEGWPAWLRWSLIAGTSLLIVVESGFTPAALAYLADIAGQTEGRGAAMGIYTLLLGLGSGIGAGIGGWLGNALAFNGLLLGTIVLLALAFAALGLLPAEGRAAVTANTSANSS
ncbi:MAG: MFS transporter [Chloroflexales bacterium]|nr:MFS transporter [Chloroflexales bacterium]